MHAQQKHRERQRARARARGPSREAPRSPHYVHVKEPARIQAQQATWRPVNAPYVAHMKRTAERAAVGGPEPLLCRYDMQFCFPSPSLPLDWRRGATRDGAVLPRFASRLTLRCRGGSGSWPSWRRRLAQKYLSRSLSVRRGTRRSSACLVSAAAKRGPITSRLFELSPLPRSCCRALEDRDGDRTGSSCFLRRALLLQRSFCFLLYFVSP